MGKDDMCLLWGSGSGPCWRVMITLEEKGFSGCKKDLLSFSKKEHKSEKVVKLNPRGQVPTFTDGEIVICESDATCDYLEAVYKKEGTKLIPEDPKQMAAVLQKRSECKENFTSSMMMGILYYMFTAKDEEKETEKFKTKLAENKAKFLEELKKWEEYLKDGKLYIANESFSMADVYLISFLATAVRFGLKLEGRFPNLLGYYKHNCERPSVKASWPPHWLEGENQNPPLADV